MRPIAPIAAVASQTPAGVTATITGEDEIAVDGTIVTQEQLKGALETALAAAKDKVVILRGDRDVDRDPSCTRGKRPTVRIGQ